MQGMQILVPSFLSKNAVTIMINLYHYEIIIIKLSRQIFVCMMSASLIIEHGLDEGQLNHLPESS